MKTWIVPFILVLAAFFYFSPLKNSSLRRGDFSSAKRLGHEPIDSSPKSLLKGRTLASSEPLKENSPSSWISFDASMIKAAPSFLKCYANQEGKRWEWLKKLYEQGIEKQGNGKIPKIIHQIWIGGPFPEKYKELQNTWKEKNPDWEYRLWTDADLIDFPFTDKERFDRAINVGEKADILRYDILLHYGGLYVDTDFECLKSFDSIHSKADFYAGLEAAFCEDQAPAMGNALIASIPNHPILKYCLKEISRKAPGRTPDEVQSVSGPGCLRKAFFKKSLQKGFKNIAFPYTFFYPIPSPHRRDERREEWIEPESFGVHYWDVSWVKSENF